MVGAAVVAGETGAVDSEDHRQSLQADIVHDLVVGALQEGRVDADDRAHPLRGETGGEGDRVLFGDADVEEAIWVDRLELGERGAGRHGGGDGDDPGIVFGQLDQRLREDILILRRRRRCSRRRGRGDGVAALAVGRRAREASALFGHDMQEHGPGTSVAWRKASTSARMSCPSTGPM